MLGACRMAAARRRTVPMETDSSWESVSFLSGFEGTDGATSGSYDEGPIGHATAFFTGGRIESDNAPIGLTSLYNNGSGGMSLPMDHASFNFGSGDFTIEAKVRFDDVSATRPIFSRWVLGATFQMRGYRFQFDPASGGKLQFLWNHTDTTQYVCEGAWSPSINTVYTVAVTRSGNDFKVFVNGSQVGSTLTQSGAIIHNGGVQVGIGNTGGTFSGAGIMLGYIDELRVTKGVARYTGTYTPRTTAFPRVGPLRALTFAGGCVRQTAPAGTVLGTISGKTTGSTLTLTADASGQFSINGNTVEVASSLSAGDYTITVRETLAGHPDSPKDTSFAVTVGDRIRSSAIVGGGGSSLVVTWPSGTAAGDRVIIFAAGAWDVTTPSGWTAHDNSVGSFVNGGVFSKVMTSTDISNGSVTVSFGGSYGCVAASVCCKHAALVASSVASRDIATGGSINLTGGLEGDDALFFAGVRDGSAGTGTISIGSSLQASDYSSNQAHGRVTRSTLAAAGTVSPTITHNGRAYFAGILLR